MLPLNLQPAKVKILYHVVVEDDAEGGKGGKICYVPAADEKCERAENGKRALKIEAICL